jgi:hypothetical protein
MKSPPVGPHHQDSMSGTALIKNDRHAQGSPGQACLYEKPALEELISSQSPDPSLGNPTDPQHPSGPDRDRLHGSVHPSVHGGSQAQVF